MTTNRVKRMLAEQHEYKAHEDAESRNGTFEVQDDHRAFGVRVCEMCGGQVDRCGETTQATDQPNGDAVQAFAAMARWVVHQPTLAKVLAFKVVMPLCSVREIADAMHISKSMAHEYLGQVVDTLPAMRKAMGLDAPRAKVQQQRRRKEATT